MLQQLKTIPFDKTSALAMLNTLFPPGVKDLPNDRIIPKFMEQQRNTFFQYISVLEKSTSGSQLVKEFEKKLLSSENRHNYQSVRWRLREYINLAETMATKADCVYGIEFFRGAEDGARALSRAETPSPIRTAKEGLLSKKSLGNIRHRFTLARQRKLPEADTDVNVEYIEPMSKPGDNSELGESAVIVARVKAFSRPTTFIRPKMLLFTFNFGGCCSSVLSSGLVSTGSTISSTFFSFFCIFSGSGIGAETASVVTGGRPSMKGGSRGVRKVLKTSLNAA